MATYPANLDFHTWCFITNTTSFYILDFLKSNGVKIASKCEEVEVVAGYPVNLYLMEGGTRGFICLPFYLISIFSNDRYFVTDIIYKCMALGVQATMIYDIEWWGHEVLMRELVLKWFRGPVSGMLDKSEIVVEKQSAYPEYYLHMSPGFLEPADMQDSLRRFSYYCPSRGVLAIFSTCAASYNKGHILYNYRETSLVTLGQLEFNDILWQLECRDIYIKAFYVSARFPPCCLLDNSVFGARGARYPIKITFPGDAFSPLIAERHNELSLWDVGERDYIRMSESGSIE